MLRWLLVVVPIACGGGTARAPDDAAIALGPVPAVRTIPPLAAPHGGAIAAVALTAAGDAAITHDHKHRVRLWPRLDGTREPIVVAAEDARGFALVRDGARLVAAVLYANGALEVLRFTADGALEQRTPVDRATYDDVAAVDARFYARRRDTVDRISLDARITATLTTADHASALVARDGKAIVAFTESASGAATVIRRIDDAMQWSAPIRLPLALEQPFALSPGGARLAGFVGDVGTVVDLDANAVVVRQPVTPLDKQAGFDASRRTVGFVNATDVVWPNHKVNANASSRWGGATPMLMPEDYRAGTAYANGLVVEGSSSYLVLAEAKRSRFLGYRDVAFGNLQSAGAATVFAKGDHAVWLTADLAQVRRGDVPRSAFGINERTLVLDDHHILHKSMIGGNFKLFVADTKAGIEHSLGIFESNTLEWEPATRVLASVTTKGVQRVQLDLETHTKKPLPALSVTRMTGVALLDPAKANGIEAIGYRSSQDFDWMKHGGPSSPPVIYLEYFMKTAKAGALQPTGAASIDGVQMLGVDRTGTAWLLGPATLQTYKLGKTTAYTIPSGIQGGAIDPTGARIVLLGHDGLYCYANGTLVWRERIAADHDPYNVVFTTDGQMVHVATSGGVIALDAATGAHRAARCAWTFGLHDREPDIDVLREQLVCD